MHDALEVEDSVLHWTLQECLVSGEGISSLSRDRFFGSLRPPGRPLEPPSASC